MLLSLLRGLASRSRILSTRRTRPVGDTTLLSDTEGFNTIVRQMVTVGLGFDVADRPGVAYPFVCSAIVVFRFREVASKEGHILRQLDRAH